MRVQLMGKRVCALGLVFLLLFAAGCQSTAQSEQNAQEDAASEDSVQEGTAQAQDDAADAGTNEVVLKGIDLDSDLSTEASAEETEPEEQISRGLIVIDPGHQEKGDSDTEPNGPGSSEMKAKVSSGTAGVSTGKNEYELNLEVSLKLREELKNRGYEVIMTRETNEVRISNAERATIANEAGADAFVRIHANGDSDHSANGILTICQTDSNPYNADLHDESYLLSELILDAMVEATGAKRLYIWETDTMTGINWAEVPSTIVEMGFMTNAEEDEKLATESYQYQIVEGIANGIDAFMDAQAE